MANGSNVIIKLLLPGILLFTACGSPSNSTSHLTGSAAGNGGGAGTGSPTTGSAGTTGAAGSSSTPTTGAAGTGGPTTGGAGNGASAAVCTTYCSAIQMACTGPNAQYKDMADCMKACSFLPAGTLATEDTGNSVYCRTNHAGAALGQKTTVKSECWAAGPLGYGTCGSECETFCTMATAYCSPANGYTGAPIYKGYDDCYNACQQLDRVVEFEKPGIYSANYTPGPAADHAADTLECRTYHLVINAMQGGANQMQHCPHAAAKSDPCGPGPDLTPPPPPSDGGVSGDAGAVPTYDGGLVNIINSTNWDETKYPPNQRKMLLRDEGDPHLVMIDLKATPILVWKQAAGGPWARAAQLIGNNQILGGRNDGYEVFDYTTGKIVKTVNKFGNTQSAYRLATGETMLTQSGTNLTFLDKNDAMIRKITYNGYGYVRVARPTRRGTFLVPSDTKLFEGDATGKVLWSTSGAEWGHIWEPLLLGPPVGGGAWVDGDVLVCTAFGSSCDVVDQTAAHKVGFRFGTKKMKDAASVRPNFFSEFEILPNGNIFCSNWQGHGGGNGNNGIQVLEFDPKGNVVWFWKQDPSIFSSIQGVQVMDGKNPACLHAQEISPDSTWQPVMSACTSP
jgi:hypothetical protein